MRLDFIKILFSKINPTSPRYSFLIDAFALLLYLYLLVIKNLNKNLVYNNLADAIVMKYKLPPPPPPPENPKLYGTADTSPPP